MKNIKPIVSTIEHRILEPGGSSIEVRVLRVAGSLVNELPKKPIQKSLKHCLAEFRVLLEAVVEKKKIILVVETVN